MKKLRVAYVTVDWGDPNNKEGALHGNAAVMRGIAAALEGVAEIVHVTVPGTFWNEDWPYAPELVTWLGTDWVVAQSWDDFDLVLNSEFGFIPVFEMMGLAKAWNVIHLDWTTLKDEWSVWLERCARFASRMVVPTQRLLGAAAQLGVEHVRFLPYPMPEDSFGGFDQAKEGEPPLVVWAAREDDTKDAELLLDTVKCLRSSRVGGWGDDAMARFRVYASYMSDPMRQKLEERGVTVRVCAPMEECHRAIGAAKVVLSTSRSELYATTLVEGALSGAVPVFPSRLSLPHLYPHGRPAAPNGVAMAAAVHSVVAGPPRWQEVRAWGRLSFGAVGGMAGQNWRAFVKEVS